MLSAHPSLIMQFVSKYNLEKGIIFSACNADSDMNNLIMEVDENDLSVIQPIQSQTIVENLTASIIPSSGPTSNVQNPQNVDTPAALSIHNALTQISPHSSHSSSQNNVPDYKENDLFFLLKSSLKGRQILETYKFHKNLLMRQLVDLLVYHFLEQNEINYK